MASVSTQDLQGNGKNLQRLQRVLWSIPAIEHLGTLSERLGSSILLFTFSGQELRNSTLCALNSSLHNHDGYGDCADGI